MNSNINIPKSYLAKTVSLLPYNTAQPRKIGFLKCAAFTLAEVLITLTIIGVVAAMTIPTLVSKYQKHTYVVGLKKAYSVISQAVKMMPITEGCSAGDYDCLGELEGNYLINLLAKQLKIAKKCDGGNTRECVDIEDIKKIPACYSGTNTCYGTPFIDMDTIVTEDGMSFSSSYGLWVDVNGKKGPNKMGRDIFVLDISNWNNYVQKGTVLPVGSKMYSTWWSEGYPSYWNANPSNPGCNGKDEDTMDVCAGRVLEENAMNY